MPEWLGYASEDHAEKDQADDNGVRDEIDERRVARGRRTTAPAQPGSTRRPRAADIRLLFAGIGKDTSEGNRDHYQMKRPPYGSEEMRQWLRARAAETIEDKQRRDREQVLERSLPLFENEARSQGEARKWTEHAEDDREAEVSEAEVSEEQRRRREYYREYARKRRARLAEQRIDRTPRPSFCVKCLRTTRHYVAVDGELSCTLCIKRRGRWKPSAKIRSKPCRRCGRTDRLQDGRAGIAAASGKQRETPEQRAARIARLRAAVVRWGKRNPNAARMLQRTSQQRRRARRAAAPVVESFSRADIDRIFAETGGRCAYCCLGKRKLTLDHIIPLFVGGEHSDLNLIGACLSCNSSKHVGLRSPKLWRNERQRAFIEIELLRRR